MRLTKFNHETGLYEYIEKAKTQAEFNEQRKAVIQKLGEYEDRAEGEWISVEDRLPKKEGKYLICTINGYVTFGYFNNTDDGKLTLLRDNPHFDYRNVIYWMPLPEPPKMKGECNEQR